MQNIGSLQIIDNRSQFQALNNYVGFCAKGSGFWTVALQYSSTSTGPWTTPGGSSTVTNFNTTCIGAYLGYQNFFRFNITGSAVVSYSAVKDFWMPQGAGAVAISLPVVPYVTNATTSPMLIPQAIHGQGPNTSVDCWSLPLTVDLHLMGNKVLCYAANDGAGNLTVQWFTGTVGAIMVSAAGTGPPGPGGPGANPYVTNATTSPQLITQTTHGQGFNVTIGCWSGPLVGGHITGTLYPCNVVMDPAGSGNVTISWTGTAVGCIMVSASGRPAPYVANTTTSPMTITQATHNQGYSPNASCWSGSVISGVTTGFQVLCSIQKTSLGDVTVSWGGSTVGSVQIQ